jgi:ATP-dependent Clp protease ATP-binding subunit ClpC
MIEDIDPSESKKDRKPKQNPNSKTPVLDNFSRDLSKLAELGALDPVVGRDEEILRIAQILSRRKKNNPIIIGEPGCGKTAIVEGLAQKIFEGDCPRNLCDKRIVSLDMTSIVAGTKYRGQFEERLKVILEELQETKEVIVFIDEIHNIVGAGNSSGSLDASNIFKPALARGEIQCIGATTLDEYRQNIEKDGALERRFQKVVVEPPSVKETIQILTNIKDKYEDFHKVIYHDDAITACVRLADRYITNREFPDKAIDILDELGARSQVTTKLPESIEKLKEEAADIKRLKLEVVKAQRYEEAANLRDREKKVLKELEDQKNKFEKEQNTIRKEISEDMVYDVVASITKIPVSKLSADDVDALINLENNLNEKVIGQHDAVEKISKAIRRNRLGIKDPNRPIGSFIFLGSTGVGKTYLAKQLAKQVFGDANSLIRVDMSEFQEKHSLSRLIGSPPGYVGYNEGGQLTEQVKNKPYSVILFDEVEKANKDIFSLMLQILDDGYITDSTGRHINFKNTLIIMTSNLGVKKLMEFGTGVGFNTASRAANNEELKRDILKKEVKNYFSPEFLNRVDEIVLFNSLNENDIHKIIEIEFVQLKDRLDELGYYINFDDSIYKHISKIGYDEEFGARPLKRAIQEQIEDFISENVLRKNIVLDKKYELYMKEDKVTLRKKR